MSCLYCILSLKHSDSILAFGVFILESIEGHMNRAHQLRKGLVNKVLQFLLSFEHTCWLSATKVPPALDKIDFFEVNVIIFQN